MKVRLIPIFCAFTLCLSAHAQRSLPCFDFKEKESYHEFDFLVYSLRELPSVIYDYSYDHNQGFQRGFHHSVAHGVRYRHRWQRHGIRLGLGYYNVADGSFTEDDHVRREHVGFYHGFDLNFGYQYSILPICGKGILYASADYRRTLGNANGVLTDIVKEDVPEPVIVETSYREKIREHAIGINLGLDWHLNRKFSASIETGIDFLTYERVNQLNIHQYGQAVRLQAVHGITINYLIR